jgi:hypothetical protein
MPRVSSTAIDRIAYEANGRMLFVTFKDGDLYAYDDVSEGLYRAFLDAESKGAFFAHEIRDRYPYQRIRRSA